MEKSSNHYSFKPRCTHMGHKRSTDGKKRDTGDSLVQDTVHPAVEGSSDSGHSDSGAPVHGFVLV